MKDLIMRLNLTILAVIFFLLIFFNTDKLMCDGSAGEKSRYESRYVVDLPTSGVVPKNDFALYSNFFAEGGMMVELTAAPFNGFNMGLSFGGTNIIGSGDPNWQNYPGIQIRWRLIDETKLFPAFSIGVNTQGRGKYNPHGKNFQAFSPGLYIAASKNYSWFLGTIAFHGGITFSFEPSSKYRVPNPYLGIEQSLGKNASINIEYNFLTNQNNNKSFSDRGLLNAAIRCSLTDGLTIELQARDLLVHQTSATGFMRTFGVEYIGKF
jgi:hypothetical protein